ncbi:MAG: VOC family protein [Alphaproteobacteria bacterium]|nr:VOC family protein [Alphaproteobacteria bacterium]
MIIGLNHITLAVRNLESAFDFYKNVLRLSRY